MSVATVFALLLYLGDAIYRDYRRRARANPFESFEPSRIQILGLNRRRWRPFDPGKVITLVREQRPHDVWLADALAKCTSCLKDSDGYICFVDPSEFSGSSLPERYREPIVLHDSGKGDIVLDILPDLKVAGLGFIRTTAWGGPSNSQIMLAARGRPAASALLRTRAAR